MRRITATIVLAAVTGVVSLAITVAGLQNHAAVGAGFIPIRVSGAVLPPELFAVPAWLTPLSATLVHGGPLHLLLNLVMLFVTGRDAERILGPWCLLLLYVVGAYAAALAQWLPDPQSVTPMVGASGAISAVVGAYALFYGRTRARAIGPIPAKFVHAAWLIAAWTVLNIMFALAMGSVEMPIAWPAHVGGFIAGITLAPLLLRWRWRSA